MATYRNSKEHDLKTWEKYFMQVVEGMKTFELRKFDRDFQIGDTLRLREWNPTAKKYTGREVSVVVLGVAHGKELEAFGLMWGFCIISFFVTNATLKNGKV